MTGGNLRSRSPSPPPSRESWVLLCARPPLCKLISGSRPSRARRSLPQRYGAEPCHTHFRAFDASPGAPPTHPLPAEWKHPGKAGDQRHPADPLLRDTPEALPLGYTKRLSLPPSVTSCVPGTCPFQTLLILPHVRTEPLRGSHRPPPGARTPRCQTPPQRHGPAAPPMGPPVTARLHPPRPAAEAGHGGGASPSGLGLDPNTPES